MNINKLTVLLILFFIIFCVKSEGNKDIILFLLFVAVVTLILDCNNVENFTDTEALQNLASLYNGGQASITNLVLPNNGTIQANDGTGTITLKGNVVVSGTMTCNGNTTVTGTHTVTGATTNNGGLTVKNGVNADSLTSSGAVTANGALNVKGTSSLATVNTGAINSSGNITASDGTVQAKNIKAVGGNVFTTDYFYFKNRHTDQIIQGG